MKKRLCLILVIIMMAVIFIHSAMPADLSLQESSGPAEFLARVFALDLDTATTIVRKCGHLIEYLILGVLLYLYLSQRVSSDTRSGKKACPSTWKGAGFALVIGIVYSITDEIHQLFVPGRSCELRDVFIDTAGVAAGILIAVAFSSGMQRK